MKRNEIRGEWDHLKRKIQATWEKLTESDIETIRGSRDGLVAKIRETYGVAREEAVRQVEAFEKEASSAARRVSAKVRGTLDRALEAAGGALDRASDGVSEYRKAVAASSGKSPGGKPSRSRARRPG